MNISNFTKNKKSFLDYEYALRNKANKGFSLVELVVVIAVLAILSAVAIPAFVGVQERAAVEVAKQFLLNAFKECLIKDAGGDTNPTYIIPPNNKYFEFPDSGDDGMCFSPSSGNILTAARTDSNGQTVSYYNININLKTGEKTTDRTIPSYLNWE